MSFFSHKYYKTIFLGLLDMALVNGFIVHRESKRNKRERLPTHANYMRVLQEQLVQCQRETLQATCRWRRWVQALSLLNDRS